MKDLFKTSKGKYIEPLILESYFADITDFEQICGWFRTATTPLLRGTSEVGLAKSNEALETELSKRLEKVNQEVLAIKE